MTQRPRLASLLVALLLSLAQFSQSAGAVELPPPLHFSESASTKLACRPISECSVCPENQMSEPACRPYGNRRLVHCLIVEDERARKHGAPPGAVTVRGREAEGQGRSTSTRRATIHGIQQSFSSWEPCVRAIQAERQDYWEFVLCNLLVATVALFVIVIRGRMIAVRHYTQLAASIGFPIQQILKRDASTGTTQTV